MTRRTILTFPLLLLVAFSSSVVSPSVLAATTAPANPSNVGQALEIAPPLITLSVDPGQTVSTAIYLRDIAHTNLLVTGQANDFVAAGEDGTPKLLLKDEANNPYSMKNWVQGLPSLQLIPREIKAMTVTLHVPKDATPGGHYGVIRFTATPPNLESTGVSLSASLGALMLITVNGNITEKLAVQEFSVNQNEHTASLFETPPVNFVTIFKNTGNVHEQPTGQITVTDMLGRKVASVNVNLPPRNILPSSSRKFEAPLDKTVIGDQIMLGRYSADLRATYGLNKTVLVSHLDFWVIPYRLIIFSIVGLILAFLVLRFVIRRYNRLIISQAERGRRR